MSDKKSKKDPKQSLVKAQESHGLSLEQVMAHPAVVELNQKLEETRQLIAGLPEAIGRAVAEAQRASRIPSRASGPPVSLMGDNANVEFHRKGRIVQDGKEIAPEGPTQVNFVQDIKKLSQISFAPKK